MDTQRFDHIASSFAETHTRRSALRALAAVAFGAGSLAVLGSDNADAKKRGKKKGHGKGHGHGGGSGSGGGGGRKDRCGGPVGICNADPTPCGHGADNTICGCERTVEGNNACISGSDNVCNLAYECTSTDGPEETSCRNLVGFHFYCQEAKRAASGQFCGCGFGTATGRVCVPECDNSNPF